LQQENEEIVLRSLLAEEEAQRLKLEEEEARLKIQLKEEEAARLAAEQLLIQQKNEQLQKELLVGAMHLNQKNELLANLTDQIKQESVSSLQSINAAIKENLMLDKDFEQFKNNLQNLHPEFFGKLQQYADGKLTALDLKYCAYIYMKLSSKQIASTMHVEQKTVRMTKYRIKKKLGLDKDTDLDNFIENII
jgi:DNA-binding CsgD family transcriptional regulator